MAGGKRGDRFRLAVISPLGNDHANSRRLREGFDAARNLTGLN
jgi:hypothetical protein